jgi:uncharacterized membrane protein YeaQ/YmgE (transglycosylase-associated protein family)
MSQRRKDRAACPRARRAKRHEASGESDGSRRSSAYPPAVEERGGPGPEGLSKVFTARPQIHSGLSSPPAAFAALNRQTRAPSRPLASAIATHRGQINPAWSRLPRGFGWLAPCEAREQNRRASRARAHVCGGTMSIIGWIVLGLISGFIASKVMNKSGEGFILDVLLGVVGALVGGFLFNLVGASGVNGFNLWSMFVAVIGAMVVLAVKHALMGRRGAAI